MTTPQRTAPWTDQPPHVAWLEDQARRQLAFGARFPAAGGGAHWLDDDGRPDPAAPVHTWVTARMLHVYSLGHLMGVPGAGPLAQWALAGLTGPLRDAENGGWFAAVGPDGDTTKAAYAHAFVVFGSSSAAVAGIPGGEELLAEALEVLDTRFWEDDAGLHRDSWDAGFTALRDYRGINANMHAVEALLAASDATGDPRWRERAGRVAEQVVTWANDADGRLPEHFDPAWTPMLEYHADEVDHPFEPYGATVGHGLEWARLLLHVDAALGGREADPARSERLTATARLLFDRAVADGWDADGAEGFVYTTDWSGRPVVRLRLHWVAAEAISAAAALHRATGDQAYDTWYRRWWDYVARYLLTPDGSWRHELDAANEPSAQVWAGRPDLYHSFHAVLLPRLPLAPMAPLALAQGLLGR